MNACDRCTRPWCFGCEYIDEEEDDDQCITATVS